MFSGPRRTSEEMGECHGDSTRDLLVLLQLPLATLSTQKRRLCRRWATLVSLIVAFSPKYEVLALESNVSVKCPTENTPYSFCIWNSGQALMALPVGRGQHGGWGRQSSHAVVSQVTLCGRSCPSHRSVCRADPIGCMLKMEVSCGGPESLFRVFLPQPHISNWQNT